MNSARTSMIQSARAAVRSTKSSFVSRRANSTSARCLTRQPHSCLAPPSRIASRAQLQPSPMITSQRFASVQSGSSGRSPADEIAEELQLMYAETKDEFEIATESSEAHATYAAEDREAARDELAKLIARWQEVLEQGGEVAEDLKRRPIGQRIRELNAAIEELNKKDYED